MMYLTKGVPSLLEITYKFISYALCSPLTGLFLRRSHGFYEAMAEVVRG